MIASWWANIRQQEVDTLMLAAVLALSLLGMVMVMSASLQIAATDHGDAFYFFRRHGIFWVLALLVGFGTYALIPLAWFERLGILAFFAAVVALSLVFIPGLGHSVNGSTRWVNLGGLRVQPSEAAKFLFVIYLAGFINRRYELLMTSWKSFIAPLLLLGVLGVLLLLQPDFGTLAVTAITTLGMLFLAGAPLRRFALIAAITMVLGAFIVVAEPYRVARLMSFMNPWADQYDSGYQLTQSLIAFGSGHWFGVGLGNSVQKLYFLPEAHTDFISAVIAEELGLVGNVTLMALVAVVIARLFLIGHRLAMANLWYQALCVQGFAIIFSAQAFINLGVSMGALPTKGLTLPFVSYGGSSLIISAVMIALALRADADLKALNARGGAA